MDKGVERIIDANFNRAQEGLRVCEEYLRFVLNDKNGVETLKGLRHSLQKAEALLFSAGCNFTAARDTVNDVGTVVTNQSESCREDGESVALASCKRLEEALRVLEEYSKVVSSEAATVFEKIRYAVYELESKFFRGNTRRQKLADSSLYVLITESLSSTDAVNVCKEAVAGGADIIQMREKDLEDNEFYERAAKMCEICAGKALFILNDRPHICALVDADGIHTGQGDLPVNLARKIIGRDKIIGKSTSAPEYAEKAYEDGADYIGVGPVYPTNTKEHRAAVGLEYVKWNVENAKLPFFCIGSINRETLAGVLETGARSVAVCTAIINAKDIAAETAWFKEQITQYQNRG